MKLVDEPAAELEPRLREQGIEVRREPYDPKSRSLVADFFRFLRDPEPGDTVTLWEDENGRVRYFTVQRVDPQLAELQARVAKIDQGDPAVIEPRFEAIEAKLSRIDALESQVAKVDALEAKVAKVDELATQVDKLPAIEAKVADIGKLTTRVARLEKPS